MTKFELLALYLYQAREKVAYGKDIFPKYFDEILELDKIDFLAYNVRNFDARYNFELMLCVPKLWENFSQKEWIELMTRVGERPKKIKPIDDSGMFSDVQFLCKYLEIDGVSLYISLENINKEDKIAVMNYAIYHQIFFVKTEWDYEDFSDETYLCNLKTLKNIKDRLLKGNLFKPFPTNEKVIEKHFINLASELTQN